MSVMPGFGGQKFDPVALGKLRWLRDHPQCEALLEVDGGVDLETAGPCAEAGAELFVAGTAIFKSQTYAETTHRLRSDALAMMPAR
jgi:ribulose-phosphate 3-epimerase